VYLGRARLRAPTTPRYNKLEGSLPLELGELSELTFLKGDYNQLGGSLPPGLGALSRLRYMILGYNQFVGEIPESLGDLTELYDLELHNNYLTSLPDALSRCTALTSLSVSLKRLHDESPWSQFTSECQWFGPPPRVNN
jgi:Leucine-rich repeat (LRR) protein